MSKKTAFYGSLAFLGIIAAIILIKVDGWSQKSPSAIVVPPALGGSPGQGRLSPSAENAKAHALVGDFGRVPIFFVPNRGQTDDRVSFYVQGADKTVYFTPDGLTIAVHLPTADARQELKRWVVKLDFLGARTAVKPDRRFGEGQYGRLLFQWPP